MVYQWDGPRTDGDVPIGCVKHVTQKCKERIKHFAVSRQGGYTATVGAPDATLLLIVGLLLHEDLDKGDLQGDLYGVDRPGGGNSRAMLDIAVAAERFDLAGEMRLMIVPSSGWLCKCYQNDLFCGSLPGLR